MYTCATINSIFVEIQPDFMNINMTLVYTLIYVQLKARIPFHLYGTGSEYFFYLVTAFLKMYANLIMCVLESDMLKCHIYMY